MSATVGTSVVVPARERDAALDGLRALAAVAVLATHTGDASGTAGWTHDVLGIGTLRTGLAIQQLNVGVDIFFVISAFLVYRPFAAAHLAGTTSPAALRFFRRRFWRIYPAYWLALWVIVVASAVKTLPGTGTFVANSLLVHGWRGEWLGTDTGLRQSWTLVVEVAFYALVPLWAGLVRAAGRRVGAFRAELLGVTIWFVLGPLSLWWLQHNSYSTNPVPLPYLGVFAWGMLFAVVDVRGLRMPRRWVSAPVCWIAGAVVFVVFVQRTGINPQAAYALSDTDALVERIVHSVVAALFVAPLVLGTSASKRLFDWKPLALVGVWSYGFYLWHYWMLDLLHDHVFTDGSLLFWRLFLPSAVLAAACGALSWYLVERPLMRRSRPRS